MRAARSRARRGGARKQRLRVIGAGEPPASAAKGLSAAGECTRQRFLGAARWIFDGAPMRLPHPVPGARACVVLEARRIPSRLFRFFLSTFRALARRWPQRQRAGVSERVARLA